MAEEEVRPSEKVKKATHQYFESIFEKYDRDNSGYIELRELQDMVKDNSDVSKRLARKILQISDTNRDGKINYPEFVDMLRNEKFKSVFGHYMNLYIRFIVPRRRRQRVLTTDGLQAVQTFDEEDGSYEDQYACCPPPIAMFLISIIEFACFLIDEVNQTDSTKTGTGVTARIFIYDPHRRVEFWRYLTYMFVHIGYMHLVVNLGVQLLLGVPLEMVHKWWRIMLVYFAGVTAGSLATSITDPTSYLAGASGGVYAIMTAHIATIIMNWREMSFPGVILFMFLLVIVTDVSTSIYNRYCLDIHDRVGYAAHFAGAIAGLLVGIWILKNFVPSRKETYLWWFALVVYLLLVGTMILLNIVMTDHFLK
ncbi:rhomboid-related protein 2-like [Anoplophora glabripennis]|uniref:rhomboid-related protein 2-like n=1 Tax=Anoplophora glabripennis TaxID=217634 RepID=UPI0008737E54|nr:rhomboid-related protein 2-like [Anoplophora glabripennis]